MFLLKPHLVYDVIMPQDALHSTMFLLKLDLRTSEICRGLDFTFHNVSIKTISFHVGALNLFFFTFHNVSIKTIFQHRCPSRGLALHSTMFLLKPFARQMLELWEHALHSTMFLLKLHNNEVYSVRNDLYIPQCFY